MNPDKVALQPSSHEEQSPFFDDLRGVYDHLGTIIEYSDLILEVDEDTLAERLIGHDERYDYGTDLYGRVSDAILSPNDMELALDAGVAIADHIKNSSRNPRGKFIDYLNTFFQVDKIKIGLAGAESSMVGENSIMYFAGLSLLEDLPSDESTKRVLDKLSSTLSNLSEKEGWFNWFMPKLMTIYGSVLNRLNARKIGSKFESVRPASIAEYGGSTQLESDVSDFVKRTMANRKYGVKPAYTKASIGGSWVFYEPQEIDFSSDKHSSALIPPMAAVVMHTAKTDFKDLRIEKKNTDLGYNASISHIGGANEEIEPDLVLYISHNGEIFTDFRQFVSLKNELKDQPGVYEAILAEVISNFYDLTSPASVVNADKLLTVSGMTDKEREKFDPVLDLLLPRLKKKYTTVEDEDESDSNRRQIRLHGVTWFVRDLPSGWSASPQAIQNAEQHGIKLGENETFVRSHKRGKDNPVTGYKIGSRVVAQQEV